MIKIELYYSKKLFKGTIQVLSSVSRLDSDWVTLDRKKIATAYEREEKITSAVYHIL